MSALYERRKRRGRVALLLLLPVLILGMLAIWTGGHDLARHEQYFSTAGLWFSWLCVTAVGVGMARDAA